MEQAATASDLFTTLDLINTRDLPSNDLGCQHLYVVLDVADKYKKLDT
jgi:hypothetical protein